MMMQSGWVKMIENSVHFRVYYLHILCLIRVSLTLIFIYTYINSAYLYIYERYINIRKGVIEG
jgi:hypothetical protein